jgi:metal-responsive CopG/Arc/MetJ family transcriptional regulator
MRTTVELTEVQVSQLDKIATESNEKISRTALIRNAIDAFIAVNEKEKKDAFGLWGNDQDGMKYQENIRSEW